MLFNAVKNIKKVTKLIYNAPTGEVTEYDFEAKSKLDILEHEDGFVFAINSKPVTPVLKLAEVNGNSFSCTTINNTHIDVEYELGFITPEYYMQNGDILVATDGKMYTVSPTKSTTFTGYTVALDDNNTPRCIGSGDDQVFVCQTSATEYDLINIRFKQILPFSMKTPEINRTFLHSHGHDYLAIYEYNGAQYVGDNEGLLHRKYPSPMKVNSILPVDGSDKYLYITLLDEAIKMTTILEYDIIENAITNETMVRGTINAILSNPNDTLYITTHVNGLMGVITGSGNQLVPHKYTSITRQRLKLHPVSKDVVDYVFAVTDGSKYGVYSYYGKELLPAKFTSVEFKESGKMFNGLYKFFASIKNAWGVVNSMGQIELPFEYKYDQLNPTHLELKHKQDNSSLHALKMEHKDGYEVLFNIFDVNLVSKTSNMRAQTPLTKKQTISTPNGVPANTPLWMLSNNRPPDDNRWNGTPGEQD